ncbi:hypothetical protein HMPREF0742_02724 [Rothia aeria F0184]|uniref:Uncharacterized protein n=2 Tax=Rothia aeria TaxID=172042 RepID=A0A2Z5R1J5_9MICC|nr:hypothetical protein HMPREF0742_02724 [Rothia aeria F0184]BAV88371.1 hypothetical protein RA11412_2072 [Rothia aeria]
MPDALVGGRELVLVCWRFLQSLVYSCPGFICTIHLLETLCWESVNR